MAKKKMTPSKIETAPGTAPGTTTGTTPGTTTGTTATVKQQYEDLPYPERDPADEAKRLVEGSPSALAEINHYIFGGRLDFSKPFRALVAGGGTGDGLIMLAQHLSDAEIDAEIHYIDLSTASRAIAEERAKRRRLTSITFHTGSLLELSELGQFDYIDCCGVLHHLPDPSEGFKALAGALKPTGGIGLMVYGTYGRDGVYEMQAVLRDLMVTVESSAEKVAIARRFLKATPKTNAFLRNPLMKAHLTEGDDAGLYDLLLHAQDRSYTVPQLAEEANGAGLRILTFIEPASYDPKFFIRDPALLKYLKFESMLEAAAFAERLSGALNKHIVYCCLAGNAGAGPPERAGPKAIPTPNRLPDLRNAPAGLKEVTVSNAGISQTIRFPPLGLEILKRCNGHRSLDEIRKSLPGSPDWFQFKPQFDAVYSAFNELNKLLLRLPTNG